MKSDKYILLTIDVEDWFQVENFKPWIPFSTWDERELRVEKNTHRLLDLFDSVELKAPNQAVDYELSAMPDQLNVKPIQPGSYEKSQPKATFFILAWIAKRLPHLVREIHSRGHEVASHGCNHQLPDQLSGDELRQDLADSKKLLEDIIGAGVVGYRAPSFAVNDSVLKAIEDCGYLYDSSYNSFGLHGRYGKISLNGTNKKGIAHKINENFYELPISNISLLGQTLPWGGGGYFRLLPTPIFAGGIKAALKRQKAFVFYLHPWEIDPTQPRVEKASASFKFRHYINIDNSVKKLTKLIESFSSCEYATCCHYLKKII